MGVKKKEKEKENTDSLNKGDQSETGVVVRPWFLFNDLCRRVMGTLSNNKYSTGEQNKPSNFDSFKAHDFTKHQVL